MKQNIFRLCTIFLTVLGASSGLLACNAENPSVPKEISILPDTSKVDPFNPPLQPGTPENHEYVTDVLLFNGSGVSTSDWQSTEQILKNAGFSYQLVNSAQLNAMTPEQIIRFGLIVVPGGSGGTQYKSLTEATRLRVRRAVRDHGVSYVGFCAGAWVAVGPESDTNNTASYGMAVAEGPVLDYWYPPGNEYATADIVDVTFANGSKRNLVWWGGPATPEWKGGVVARYSTGDPAISQAWSGQGFVVISGPHPEAPQGWRSTAGTDSDGLDFELAIAMFNAALKKQPMPVFP
jgi:hypothetical protein